MTLRQREIAKFMLEVFLTIVLTFAIINHVIRWGSGGTKLQGFYGKMVRSSDDRADDAWEQMNRVRENAGRWLSDAASDCSPATRQTCSSTIEFFKAVFGLHE